LKIRHPLKLLRKSKKRKRTYGSEVDIVQFYKLAFSHRA
jgi:hypothetical protein